MPIRIGEFYSITEWDGTQHVVKVVARMGDDLVMEYADGVAHRVTVQYFITGVHAQLLRASA